MASLPRVPEQKEANVLKNHGYEIECKVDGNTTKREVRCNWFQYSLDWKVDDFQKSRICGTAQRDCEAVTCFIYVQRALPLPVLETNNKQWDYDNPKQGISSFANAVPVVHET
jgi:hypothetical protein